MKPTQAPATLGLVALSLIASTFAAAQEPGWYVGVGAGQSRSRLDDTNITQGLMGPGFSAVITSEHDKDLGFKLFTGYRFSRFFSVEGGYFNLGKADFLSNTLPAGTLAGNMKVEGVNLDGVLSLPFTEKFSAFARYGATYSEAKDSFYRAAPLSSFSTHPSNNAWSYKFGGGLQYDFTPCLGARAEYERYRIQEPVGNKGDIDLLSAGILLRFGHSRPVPAPARVVYVTPPAPLVVPAPEEPRTQTYCSTLDLQFSVDNDEIQDQDKERLAVVGTFLRKYPDTTALIEGHTDNVGTSEHNLKLSQARADNVVNYLVTKGNIAASRLKAVGYGDTRPVADNGTEEGKRMNRRIDAVIPCATDLEGLTVAPARITLALAIDFDQDQVAVKPEFDRQIRKVATFLKLNPTVNATVEGHTGDLKLTPEKSLVMSQTRAQNVVNYLVDTCGVDRGRLTATGYGSTRRDAYNTDANGPMENRRVNIIFNYPKKPLARN